MQITIWKNKTKRYKLHIYKKYYTDQIIIPLGSDCHPAYILNKFNFRKQSLVFDWLYSNSKSGLKYVNKNISTRFEFFLDELEHNENNHIISRKFPETEFFHEKNLIDSKEDQIKLKKRGERFLDIIENNNVSFLYTINPEYFKTDEDVDYFIQSIHELKELTQNKHKLKIFIKYKKGKSDNIYMQKLLIQANDIKNVLAVKYYLDTNKYGLWGNPKDHLPLMKNLNINIKISLLPNIYIQ